jgi:hypothetical protein
MARPPAPAWHRPSGVGGRAGVDGLSSTRWKDVMSKVKGRLLGQRFDEVFDSVE